MCGRAEEGVPVFSFVPVLPCWALLWVRGGGAVFCVLFLLHSVHLASPGAWRCNIHNVSLGSAKCHVDESYEALVQERARAKEKEREVSCRLYASMLSGLVQRHRSLNLGPTFNCERGLGNPGRPRAFKPWHNHNPQNTKLPQLTALRASERQHAPFDFASGLFRHNLPKPFYRPEL